MLKIVHIVSDMNFGGVGRYITLIDNHIDQMNVDFYIIMPRNSILKKYVKNMKIIELDGLQDQSFSVTGVRIIKKELKLLRADIIHTHGCLSGRIVGKWLNIPTVFTKHTISSESHGIKALLKKSLHLYLNSKAIAVSKGVYDNLKHDGFKDEDISLIYNGIASVENSSSKNTIKNRLLMVGRLEHIKGPLECLKVAALLKERMSETFEIVLAGDGSLLEMLREKVEREELAVKFLGHVDEIDSLYESAHLILNTSQTEALPYSIIEGMSHKKPVVAFDIPGIREVLINEETGFIIPYLDHQKFADKIELLLGDYDLCETMGDKGKLRVNEVFSITSMINKLLKVYEVMYENNK